MGLSSELISQFVKITSKTDETKKESTVYGTAVEYNGSMYVRLDGSDRLTPVSTTTDMKDGERVTVMIKNHTATVTGNISSPSARTDEVKEVGDKVSEVSDKINEFEIVIADKVTTEQLEAEKARIAKLEAEDVTINGKLEANEADINTLKAKDVEITGKLKANEADIKKLSTEKLDANAADIKYATIEKLDATDATLYNLQSTYAEFSKATTDKLEANDADIKNLKAKDVEVTGKLEANEADIQDLQAEDVKITGRLDANEGNIQDLQADNVVVKEKLTATEADISTLKTGKLDAESAKLLYANIDFSNIQIAAIQKLFTDSGIIKDLVVSDQKITGELVGVTLKGDLVEAGTLKADRLVVKGSDGLFYKLNVEFGNITGTEQVPTDSLHGSVITAKSIVAEKIAVDDLVAFGATIGGFHITKDSIYSGAKASANNTTRGIFLGNDGQIAFGDEDNFIKFYKDTDGKYKLAVSASSLVFSSSKKSVSETLEEIRDEMTTNLRIESSRGTVFKNNAVSTVLSAVIYRGSQRITDITTLRAAMGNSAYLQWKWQRLDESTFGIISSSDSRLSNDGFTFTLTPDDVDTKVTFMCELIV